MESEARLLEGRVTNILSVRELVINIGRNAGVRKGLRFRVMADAPLRVTDPETGKELGSLDREKTRVEVTEVSEKFSVCRTFRTRTVGVWSIAAVLDRTVEGLGSGQRPREVPETLKVGDSELPEELPEEESYVKRGDRVIQVIEIVVKATE